MYRKCNDPFEADYITTGNNLRAIKSLLAKRKKNSKKIYCRKKVNNFFSANRFQAKFALQHRLLHSSVICTNLVKSSSDYANRGCIIIIYIRELSVRLYSILTVFDGIKTQSSKKFHGDSFAYKNMRTFFFRWTRFAQIWAYENNNKSYI